MSLRIPGVTPPSSTLQKFAGRFSPRTTHCCPSMSLTIKSGRPVRSGAVLSLATVGTATRARQIANRTWAGRFIMKPPFLSGGTLSRRCTEIHREISNDQVRAGAFDRGQDLVHDARAVDPAALRGGLHHRVFAAHVVSGNRKIEVLACGANHIEI